METAALQASKSLSGRRLSLTAFLLAIPISGLGGVIGLGGAEFRLPVLSGLLAYSTRAAVSLNLAISLITLLTALISRALVLSIRPPYELIPAVVALAIASVISAFTGPKLAGRLSDHKLERVVLGLLLAIGLALIVEGVLPERRSGFLPPAVGWRVGAGILFGLAIGLVSSLLGVAGGELIIPTLVFAFGADIKAAGTASLWISIPTVVVGIERYARNGAFADRTVLKKTVAPMAAGSGVGAIAGGSLAGVAPVPYLKVALGLILIASALRVFTRGRKVQQDPIKGVKGTEQ